MDPQEVGDLGERLVGAGRTQAPCRLLEAEEDAPLRRELPSPSRCRGDSSPSPWRVRCPRSAAVSSSIPTGALRPRKTPHCGVKRSGAIRRESSEVSTRARLPSGPLGRRQGAADPGGEGRGGPGGTLGSPRLHAAGAMARSGGSRARSRPVPGSRRDRGRDGGAPRTANAPGVFLGLKEAARRLRAARTDEALTEVADLLWTMALQRIPSGNGPSPGAARR
jgi:hypothetical protein